MKSSLFLFFCHTESHNVRVLLLLLDTPAVLRHAKTPNLLLTLCFVYACSHWLGLHILEMKFHSSNLLFRWSVRGPGREGLGEGCHRVWREWDEGWVDHAMCLFINNTCDQQHKTLLEIICHVKSSWWFLLWLSAKYSSSFLINLEVLSHVDHHSVVINWWYAILKW